MGLFMVAANIITSGLWHCRCVSSSWCCGRSPCLRLLGVTDCLTPEDGGNMIPRNVKKHSPKDTVPLPRWILIWMQHSSYSTPPKLWRSNSTLISNIYTLSVKLRSHSIEGNKKSDTRTLYRCLEKCAHVFREGKNGILLRRTLYASNRHLLNQPVYCRCSKSPPLSFVAQLTAMSTLTGGHQSCCRDGCAKPFKLWQQLLQCYLLFEIHTSTISALKPHFPTIHHHFQHAFTLLETQITPPPFWLLESWEKLLWCAICLVPITLRRVLGIRWQRGNWHIFRGRRICVTDKPKSSKAENNDG